jgi:hypothetical protein
MWIEIFNYFKLNKNANTTYQYLEHTAKVVHRGKSVTLTMRNKERSKANQSFKEMIVTLGN